jgi:hypothetical protein
MFSKQAETRSRTGFSFCACSLFSLVGTAVLLTAGVCAQDHLPPGVRGPDHGMATRTVLAFLERERALQQAIDARDTGALKRLLAPDFEARMPSRQDTLSADTWRALAFRTQRMGIVRELSVYEADDLAIVSFLLVQPVAKPGRQRAKTSFIVDTWRKSTATLLTRSWDVTANAPILPERPSGRE